MDSGRSSVFLELRHPCQEDTDAAEAASLCEVLCRQPSHRLCPSPAFGSRRVLVLRQPSLFPLQEQLVPIPVGLAAELELSVLLPGAA